MPLAFAKVHTPPRPANILRRPRLLGYLLTQIDRQLVVISAPAGYGKTSLLLDLAHAAEAKVAWYALDEFDNSPHLFLRYLIESIRVHEPDFGDDAVSRLDTAADSLESLQPVVSLIANELYRLPYSLVIALDDYHVIHEELIGRLISLLIQYTQGHAHIFISSRTIPYIPDQVLLLARGQLGGLSTDDLKFNAREIQGLLQQNFALTVPEPRASALAQYCDGWVTALLLLGHQRGWTELTTGPLGTPEDGSRIYDYLAEQVFTSLPAALQRFMLGSSVIEPMSPKQLDLMPGLSRSSAHLKALAAQQLFVTRLGGAEESYRYHPLLRAFLRERLRSQHADWFEALSLAAAEQYLQAEQWERAADLYLSLGRDADVAMVLERAESSLRAIPQILSIKPWLDRISRDAQIRPHLVSIQAKTHLVRGELDRAVAHFDRAAALFMEAGNRAAAADKLIWKATALRGLGRYQACIDDCAVVTGLLAGLPEATTLAALNLSNRGWSSLELGRLHDALSDFLQVREMLVGSDDVISRATAAQSLGIAYRALGATTEAVRYFREALDLWKRAERPLDAASTLNSLGNVYYLRGELDEAETVLQDALSRARATKALRTEAIVLCTLGDVHKDRGEHTTALELYGDGLRVALEAHYAYASEYCQLATADVYRLLGDWARAREWLEAAAESIRATGSATATAQLHLLNGKLARDQGRLDEALRMTKEATSQFQQTGDKHGEALAEFIWAQLLDLSGSQSESPPHLVRAAELVEALGYDHFLVVEGAQAETTLQYAGALPKIGPAYRKILERVRPSAAHRVTALAAPGVPPALSVYALGQEKYLVGAAEVAQLRPQVRDLFLFLLARHPQGARPDELWEMLWPDLSEDRADSILHMTVTRIRKALCPVELANGWYALAPLRIWYDAREFERTLADAARARTARSRISHLLQALDLYRGEYLPRLDQYWATIERQRLAKARVSALTTLARTYYEAGEYESALRFYQRLNIEEPFLEDAWQGAIQTYARMGNRAAALAYYHKYESVMSEDVGIKPGPEAQALQRRILNMET